MKDTHSTETEQTKDSALTSNSSRRGFFKKAAIGSALITTISSRPVWAGVCSLSGNLSNNVSSQQDSSNCVNSGYSPGGWKDNGLGGAGQFYGAIKYPEGGYINYSDSIAKLLGYIGNTNPVHSPDITISEALNASGQTTWNKTFIMHIVVAALNAALWQTAYNTCDVFPNSSECQNFMNNLDNQFYWDFTVADYRSDFQLLKNATKEEQNSYATALDALWF